MKSLKLRKIVAVAVAVLTIAALSPVGASAEWKKDSNGWWNTEGSSYSIGWRNLDSTWYYFGSDGYMKTGWVKDGSTWYYLQPSGAMKTGWIYDGGTWYYTAASGAMKTGWIYDGGVWYFAAASGAMQTGVIEVDGKIYYLAPNGAMQTGNVTIDGVIYTFAASGEATGDKKPAPKFKFTSAGVLKTSDDTSDTTSTSTTTRGHGSSGSGSGTVKDPQQAVIDNVYKAVTTISMDEPVANGDGTSTIKPILKYTPGTTEIQTIDGKTYSVKKDMNVVLDDGTDVGVQGSYASGFKVPTGKHGSVSTVISLIDSDGNIHYVTPQPVRF